MHTRDCAVMMFFNIAFVFWTFVSLAHSQTGSCQVQSTFRGETAGGGGSGEAYSSRGLSGRGRARDGHDGLEFDPPAYLDRW